HRIIGVAVESMSRKDKQEKGVSFGVLVTEVKKGGLAEGAGVLAGDVIQYFNGEKIRTPGDLVIRVRDTEADTVAKIRLMRGAEVREFAVPIVTESEGTRKHRVKIISQVSSAWMGVRLYAMDDDLAGYFRVKSDEGALILTVENDSPARKAGLKSGDVIVRIGTEKVYEPGDVTDILKDKKPKDVVDVAVVRQGIETIVRVTLGERPNRLFIGGMDSPHPFQWSSQDSGIICVPGFPEGALGDAFSPERWEKWSQELGKRIEEMEIHKRELLENNQEKLEESMEQLEETTRRMLERFDGTAII
ncbi:MAG TPA: PDZ domain-containing protein, partial [bacterium]